MGFTFSVSIRNMRKQVNITGLKIERKKVLRVCKIPKYLDSSIKMGGCEVGGKEHVHMAFSRKIQ